MHFIISGVGPSGDDRTVFVEADSERHALSLASERGVKAYKVLRDHAKEQAVLAKTERQAAAERIAQAIRGVKQQMLQRVGAGQPVYLVQVEYKMLVGSHDLFGGGELAAMQSVAANCAAGWQIVSVVPHYVSKALENREVAAVGPIPVSLGSSYAGSVERLLGFFIVQQYSLSLADLDDSADDWLGVYIREHLLTT